MYHFYVILCLISVRIHVTDFHFLLPASNMISHILGAENKIVKISNETKKILSPKFNHINLITVNYVGPILTNLNGFSTFA